MRVLINSLAFLGLLILFFGAIFLTGFYPSLNVDRETYEPTGMPIIDQIEHWEATLKPYADSVIASHPSLSSTKHSLDSLLAIPEYALGRKIHDHQERVIFLGSLLFLCFIMFGCVTAYWQSKCESAEKRLKERGMC